MNQTLLHVAEALLRPPSQRLGSGIAFCGSAPGVGLIAVGAG